MDSNLFRKLPKVDELLSDQKIRSFLDTMPRDVVLQTIREVLEQKRKPILPQTFFLRNKKSEKGYQRDRRGASHEPRKSEFVRGGRETRKRSRGRVLDFRI